MEMENHSKRKDASPVGEGRRGMGNEEGEGEPDINAKLKGKQLDGQRI